jgi:hypothetical protein
MGSCGAQQSPVVDVFHLDHDNLTSRVVFQAGSERVAHPNICDFAEIHLSKRHY